MAYNLRQEMNKPERLKPGQALFACCGSGIAFRAVVRARDPGDNAVICNAT